MALRVLNVARLLFVAGAALELSVLAAGQGSGALVTHPSGQISAPVASGSNVRKDGPALIELTRHLAAVGSDPWLRMQAKGKIIFGASGGTGYDATFTTQGLDRFRLDAQTKIGDLSVRIQGHVGKSKEGDLVSAIPADTAALGLFPFALPRVLNPAASNYSLIDHGEVTIAGTALHRISYEIAGTGHAPTATARGAVVIDLYFDASSHLLIASAANGMLPDSGSTQFLFVSSYSDYRKVGASMVPFHLSETVNGEPYCTLQLSDVQLNPALNSTYFAF